MVRVPLMDFDGDTLKPLRGRRRSAEKMLPPEMSGLDGMSATGAVPGYTYHPDGSITDQYGNSISPPTRYQVGTNAATGETYWNDGTVTRADGSVRVKGGTPEAVSILESLRESFEENLQSGPLSNLAVSGKWIVAGLIALAVVELLRAVRGR